MMEKPLLRFILQADGGILSQYWTKHYFLCACFAKGD